MYIFFRYTSVIFAKYDRVWISTILVRFLNCNSLWALHKHSFFVMSAKFRSWHGLIPSPSLILVSISEPWPWWYFSRWGGFPLVVAQYLLRQLSSDFCQFRRKVHKKVFIYTGVSFIGFNLRISFQQGLFSGFALNISQQWSLVSGFSVWISFQQGRLRKFSLWISFLRGIFGVFFMMDHFSVNFSGFSTGVFLVVLLWISFKRGCVSGFFLWKLLSKRHF